MKLTDAITGRVVGYVRLRVSPYWLDQYYARDASGEMYFQRKQIVLPSLDEACHELMAYDLERNP